MILKTITLDNKNLKPSLTKRILNKTNNNFSNKNLSFNKKLLKNLKKVTEVTKGINDKENSFYLNKDNPNRANSLVPIVRKTQAIGYRNVKLLKSFLTDYKKIKSRRLTKLTLKQQRQLSKSVKRARMLKLFDPRKTLKPKKFLNFERKVQTVKILTILKLLKLNTLLDIIKTSNTIQINQMLKLAEFIKISTRKTFLN